MNNLKNIKLLFIDLDGTFYDGPHHTITEKNMNAWKQLKEKNMIPIVSTGRHFDSVRNLFEELGSEYMICSNGGQIIQRINGTPKEIFQSPIKPDVAYDIGKKVYDMGYAFKINASKIAHTKKSKKYAGSFMFKMFNFKPQYDLNFETKDVFKMVVFGKIRLKMKRLLKLLRKTESEKIDVVHSFGTWTVEVTSKGISKGSASKTIMDKLGISKEETLHIGDSGNDASTKGVVGTLVALSNASKHLKSMADIVGPHYKDGGVAKFLKDNNLI